MTGAIQSPPTLVAMKTGEGFRVYSPTEPGNIVLVSGTSRIPNCTCPEFQENVQIDPRYTCCHIEAVIGQLPQPGLNDEPTPEEERAAIRSEGRLPEREDVAQMMTFKRSISPDGRIDSLSIEFSLPVPTTVGEIKAKAFKTLSLQDELADAFRREHAQVAPQSNGNGGRNGNFGNLPTRNGSADDPGPNGPVPAMLLDIQGMNTRNGWTYFINVNASGQVAKLFGKRNELGQALTAAGYPHLSGNIQKGVQLNLPCQVILRQNGRYLNVEQVLPPINAGQPGAATGYGERRRYGQ